MPKRLLKLPGIYVKHFKESPFYVTINTIAAISFAVFFVLWYSQVTQIHSAATTAKVLALKTSDLAKQNSRLLNRIQNNRRDLIYKNCRDQNMRHNNSLTALESVMKKNGISRPKQTRAFKQTKILIDVLVPHRNCVKLANQNVKPVNTKQPKR